MKLYVLLILIISSLVSCGQHKTNSISSKNKMDLQNKKLDTAIFASGCFWCTEAIFQRVNGVEKVTSGYTGGHIKNPSYEEVCNKQTGHAEATQILFNPDLVTFDELLEIFWKTHDPTTLNQQGNDVGPQYRSAIFYLNENQHQRAIYFKNELNKLGIWKSPIVTQLEPATEFYPAENYHQNYYNNNVSQGYCRFVIT
ncbi:MAG: peptide-methionine (S)-S-oxide reductase MsrA, partial [Sediminibacterium sp.]|nr:peptide-methionine (S)-S-oxide reductase MsrA [Sediminibacterium sp.]